LAKVTYGAGVDQSTVEQVKALHRLNKSQNEIAKITGISQATVCRYIKRPDETPEQAEERERSMDEFVRRGWKLILDEFVTTLEEKTEIIKSATTTRELKDVMTMLGIMFDKLGMVNAERRGPAERSVPALVLNISCPSQPDILADAGEVLYVESAVSGDGGGTRGGEDVPRMLGSGTEVHTAED